MNDIVKMMIGREIGERYPVRNSKIGDVAFEVKKNTPVKADKISPKRKKPFTPILYPP